MKTRHLFVAMALPALFAACSQDEFVNENKFEGTPQLAAGFKLTAEKVMDAQTRGGWIENGSGEYEYKWDIETTPTSEILGLCWTGKVGDVAYTEQTSKKLFTNYEFSATAGSDDLTEEGELDNPVNVGTGSAGYKKYATFDTEASSLFAGEYVVYYPYNASFNEIGNIKATVKNKFKASAANKQYEEAGKDMFMMSGRTPMEGGQKAGLFKLNPKSTLLQLNLQLKTGESALNVDKIILFDNTGLASEMLYNADGNVVDNSVKYDDYKTITGEYVTGTGIEISSAKATPFVIPMLTVDLKATTVIYLHKKDGAWAKKEFTKPYEMKIGVMPLSISELKDEDFNLDLVTDADELKAKIEADAENIDVLTDIELDKDFTSTWNANKNITIKSTSGAKLIFDVTDGNVEFGASAKAINLACAVEVKGADNKFTLACPSTIDGEFANSTTAEFAENVTIGEEGEVINSGSLTLTAAKTLTVLGTVTNNADSKISVPATASFNVAGKNASVVNDGELENSGEMTIIKYAGNSVVNNGVVIVDQTGTFVGDFDQPMTGTFWKKAADIADLKTALNGTYSKIILAGTFDFSAEAAATVLNAGDKDIDFAGSITMPTADGNKDFTLETTGTVTINTAITLGKPKAPTAPKVTIKAGAMEVNDDLTVDATGTLEVTGDINAQNATVTFKKESTVSFDNFNNNGGASLTLENGANVTYTGKINLIPAN